MDLASYQDFKIDYTPELSELSKLKVTTNALGTGLRAKLTETLRQKRLIVAVGSQKRLAIEETRPTFDVNRDRIRELNELRNIGAARIPPWAEMHASKMFSRRRTKNVLLTQGHASASPSYAAKMVCDRLFSEPSKKKRVLERLTSDQLHEIEATERDKYKLKRRPLSELLGPCYEGQVPQEVNSSFFRGVSTDGSVADVKQQEAQPTHALAALPPSCAEWDDNTDVIRSLTPSGVIPAGAQSPSMTSILSYDECVECDSSDAPSHAIPPAPPSHAIPPAPSSHAIPPAPSSASQRHPSNSLPPHIANNPDFVAYIMRNKMEPVASAYISYKIANIGDTIDEQYADQISMALESVLTDTVETKISYVSFYKAAQKLILEGASVADRIFMLACFGRRILEGAPELHGIVKGYTQTVMEESVLQLIGNDGEWVSVCCLHIVEHNGCACKNVNHIQNLPFELFIPAHYCTCGGVYVGSVIQWWHFIHNVNLPNFPSSPGPLCGRLHQHRDFKGL